MVVVEGDCGLMLNVIAEDLSLIAEDSRWIAGDWCSSCSQFQLPLYNSNLFIVNSIAITDLQKIGNHSLPFWK